MDKNKTLFVSVNSFRNVDLSPVLHATQAPISPHNSAIEGFVQVSCGDKSVRSPKGTFSLQARKEHTFDLSLRDWFATFPDWRLQKRLTLDLFAVRKQGSSHREQSLSILIGQVVIAFNRALLTFNGHERERQFKLCYNGRKSTWLSRAVCKASIGLVFKAQLPPSPMDVSEDIEERSEGRSRFGSSSDDGSRSGSESERESRSFRIEEKGKQRKSALHKCSIAIKLKRQLLQASTYAERSQVFREFCGAHKLQAEKKEIQKLCNSLGAALSRSEWNAVFNALGCPQKGPVPAVAIRRLIAFVREERYQARESVSDDSVLSDFEAGQTVESNYLGGGKYFKCVIERKNPDGSVEVRYPDGSKETSVQLDRVRIPRLNIKSAANIKEKYRCKSPLSAQQSEDDNDSDRTEGYADEALEQLRSGIAIRQNRGRNINLSRLLQRAADVSERPHLITAQAFRHVLSSAGLKLSRVNGEALTKRLDKHRNGQLDWHLLIELLDARSLDTDVRTTYGESNVNRLLLKLGRAIDKSKDKGLYAKETFGLFDSAKSGIVTRKDAQRACSLLGCPLTPLDLRLLEDKLKILCPNNPSNKINYYQLIQVVEDTKGAISIIDAGSRPRYIKATDITGAVSRIQQQLERTCLETSETVDLADFFQRGFDPARKGVISRLQFVTGMRRLGVVVEPDDADVVLSKCAPSRATRSSNSTIARQLDYRKLASLLFDEKAIAAALLTQIRRAATRGVSAWGCFKAADPSHSGRVPRVEFRRICVGALGLHLKEHELRFLMKRFSGKSAGSRVDYVDFLNFVAPNGEAGAVGESTSGLQSKLRHTLRLAALNGEDLFEKVFVQSMSDDKLLQSLEAIGIELSQHEKQQLLARLDPTGVGTIHCEEFLRFAGFDDLEMDKIGQRILTRLQELTAEGVDYRTVYQSMDVGEEGVVSRRDFRRAARELSLPLTEAELVALMRRFAPFNDNGTVIYNDFLRFVTTRQNRILNTMLAHKARNEDTRLRNVKPGVGVKEKGDRLVRDGSGFDGLGLNDPQHGNIRSVLSQKSTDEWAPLVPGGETNDRYDRKAAQAILKENSLSKNESRRLENLIDEYQMEVNKQSHVKNASCLNETILVDHGGNTVSRIFDHGRIVHALEDLKLCLQESYVEDDKRLPPVARVAKRRLNLNKDSSIQNSSANMDEDSNIDKLRGLLEDPLTFAGLVLSQQASLGNNNKSDRRRSSSKIKRGSSKRLSSKSSAKRNGRGSSVIHRVSSTESSECSISSGSPSSSGSDVVERVSRHSKRWHTRESKRKDEVSTGSTDSSCSSPGRANVRHYSQHRRRE